MIVTTFKIEHCESEKKARHTHTTIASKPDIDNQTGTKQTNKMLFVKERIFNSKCLIHVEMRGSLVAARSV